MGSNIRASLTLSVKANLKKAGQYRDIIRDINRETGSLVGKSGKGGARFEASAGARGVKGAKRAVKETERAEVAASRAVMKTRMANFAREEKARAQARRKAAAATAKASDRAQRDHLRRVEQNRRREARIVEQGIRKEARERKRAAQKLAKWQIKQSDRLIAERNKSAKKSRFGLTSTKRTPGGGFHLASNAAQVSAGAKNFGRSVFDTVASPFDAARQQSRSVAEVTTLLDDDSDINSESVDAVTRSAAKRFGNDTQQQAKAYYDIISAGAGNARDANSLLSESNRLAIAGAADLTDSADGLTSILNAYGKSGSDAGEATASMMAAVKSGKTTIPELARSIGKVAPSANALGISMQELNAAIATTTSQGINTSESVSGLKAAFANIKKPTKDARREARRLGIDFNEASLRSKGLGKFMNEMVNAKGFKPESYTKLFGSIEAGNSVIALTTGDMKKFGSAMEDQAKGVSIMDKAVDKMMDTPDFKMRQAEQAMKNLEIEIGQGLAPAVTGLVKDLGPMVTSFSAWVGENPETVQSMGKLAIGIGGVSMAVGGLADAVMVFNAGASIVKTFGPTALKGVTAMTGGIANLADGFRQLQGRMPASIASINNFEGKAGKAAGGLGLLAAAAAGWQAGTWLDEQFALSDKLSNFLVTITGVGDEYERINKLNDPGKIDVRGQDDLIEKTRAELMAAKKEASRSSLWDRTFGDQDARVARVESLKAQLQRQRENKMLMKAGFDPLTTEGRKAGLKHFRENRESGKKLDRDTGKFVDAPPMKGTMDVNVKVTVDDEGKPIVKVDSEGGDFSNRGESTR